MKQTSKYQNKKILILGLAKSGLNAAKLLDSLGALVTVNDYQDLTDNKDARELIDHGIKVISGGHPEDLLDENFELVVKNPGIPYTNSVIRKAVGKKIDIVTEVEIGLTVNEADLIAITGTNGKTTTTSLVNDLLNREREEGHSYVAGNIGEPVSKIVQEADSQDDMVVELSSFQLLGSPSLKPHIALITNIYTAHLDYHETRENYVNAKLNITNLQDNEDYLIFNNDLEEVRKLVSERSNAHLVPFSRKEYLPQGASIKGNTIYFDSEPIVSLDAVQLPGKHNIENILAAVAIAKIKNKTNETIKSVIEHFSGVKHRSQLVGEWNNRVFINDSKATNSLATKNALEGIERPIILLAGGLDRGDNFETLAESMKEKVKTLVTFGETSDKLSKLGEELALPDVFQVDTMEEAVSLAYENSTEGDAILLSPACASWDQYINFEVRGDTFIKNIFNLMETSKEVEDK